MIFVIQFYIGQACNDLESFANQRTRREQGDHLPRRQRVHLEARRMTFWVEARDGERAAYAMGEKLFFYRSGPYDFACSTCHGDVTSMQMTYRANAFEMSFCLDCHRNPEKYVRPKDQILNMSWSPPANQAEIGPELVRQYHIRGGERLTECGICHR